MDRISVTNLTKYVEDNPEIKYVAHVATPMCVIWAKACLYYMHEEMHMSNLKGVFLVCAWTNGKYAINDKLPVKNENTPWLDEPEWFVLDEGGVSADTKIRSFLDIGKKNKSTREVYMIDTDVLWITPSLYFRKLSSVELKHFYLDFNRWPFKFAERLRNEVLLMRTNGIIPIVRMYFLAHLRSFVASVYRVEVKRIYGYDKKKFFSDEYIKYTRMVLDNEKNAYEFFPEGKYVVYLSNPYKAEERQIVAQIAEDVLVKYYQKGYKIYVKQHPREEKDIPFKQIKVEYLPKGYAIEGLVATTENKPRAVIAGSTSAVIEIARLWHDIDCFFILNDKRAKKSASLNWFRNYTNCAVKKIPNLMDAKECDISML